MYIFLYVYEYTCMYIHINLSNLHPEYMIPSVVLRFYIPVIYPVPSYQENDKRIVLITYNVGRAPIYKLVYQSH